jgi:prevent-host-death family protein
MPYTVHQAKTQFSRLLKEAESGKEVIVTRGKKPVAKIVPVETSAPAKRIPGGFEGQVRCDDSAFDPLTDAELIELGFEFVQNGNPQSEAAERITPRRFVQPE